MEIKKIIKIFFMIMIVILLVFTPLFYVGYIYYHENYVYQVPEHVLTANLKDIADSTEVLNLIEVLKKDNLKIKTEHLKILAERKDTIGFYASRNLAKKSKENFQVAEKYYQNSLDLYPLAFTTRYNLAYLYEEHKKIDKAKAQYIKLLPQGDAIKRLKNLNVAKGDILKELFNLNALVEIDEMYNDYINNETKKAELSLNDIYELKKYRSFSFFRKGNYESALQYLKNLYSAEQFDEDLWYYYARCLEETGSTDINKIKKLFARIGERASYNLALILDSQGERINAAKAYVNSNSNNSKWIGARIYEELGMINEALIAYDKITKKSGVYQDDAAYRAYILSKRLDKPKEEKSKYLDFLKNHPSWMKRLDKEPVFPNLQEHRDEYLDVIELINIYSENKKNDLISMELEIQRKHGCEKVNLEIAKRYLAEDDYYNAIVWAVRSYRKKPLRKAYEIAYPKHFKDEVLKTSKEFGVEPYLIWAIIREESHFRKSVISFAGAIGLMQIMPMTGQDIARTFNLSIDDDDLKIPSINIRFGTYYINLMLNMHGGSLDKALAAYNGGSGNVNRWERSVIGNSKDDFPTAITFLETRNYITKVRDSYYLYEWIYK